MIRAMERILLTLAALLLAPLAALCADDAPRQVLAAKIPAQPPPSLSKATLDKIEKIHLIFDGKTLDGWIQFHKNATNNVPGWRVKDGAMASTGADRGVIYSANDYGHFRLMFKIRHLSGNHQAAVLFFCTRPQAGEKPLDALAGIQFQVPNGGHWDYRFGHNNKGGPEFTSPSKTRYNSKEWSQVELLIDATKGTARMAVAQPVGTRAVENHAFTLSEAGKIGPIGWQIHNAGLFDEYKDVRVEVNPAEDRLITVE
jgi:hypothetical protein